MMCSWFDVKSEVMKLIRYVKEFVFVSFLLFEVFYFVVLVVNEMYGIFDLMVGK